MIKFNHKIILGLILVFAFVLRVWQIDKVPVSLFGDEVDIGYHSFSLLKTGRDYMGNFLPLHLESLADNKSPLYAYVAMPSVGLFGVSALGVRLPSVLLGVVSIGLFYLFLRLITKNLAFSLLGAFLLAVTPWHIHFSRWGSEAMLMITLYLGGLYFFLKGLRKGWFLVLASLMLSLSPLAYHAAKVFLPLTLIAMLLIWSKDILKVQRRHLFLSLVVFAFVLTPFTSSTLFGGGAERLKGTSLLSDPKIEYGVGLDRLQDAKSNNGQITAVDRLFHNRFTSVNGLVSTQYLQAFSMEFLFLKGDPNLRHSIQTDGEFLKIEILFLILGIVFFASKPLLDKKYKVFLVIWLILAPIPAVFTKDGGMHAIRLMFLLLPLVILITAGVYFSYLSLNKLSRKIILIALSAIFLLSFVFYQHNYWVHYPLNSEKWWHAGFEEAIDSTIEESKNYEKVIISSADEPAMVFFLGFSQYPPADFQKKYPLEKVSLGNLGEVEKLDNFYFPPIGKGLSLYEMAEKLPDNSVYLASFKEINLDLIKEPERVPANVRLIKSIQYPSGNPAFYLLTKNQ